MFCTSGPCECWAAHGLRASSSGRHHPRRGCMVHHRAPCPRAHLCGCSSSPPRPLPQAATRSRGCSAPLLAGASRASPVPSVAREAAHKAVTKLTLGFVIMLTEVSPGAGRSVRLGTVATPSSSLSFYMGDTVHV